jgi:hypothetical protein
MELLSNLQTLMRYLYRSSSDTVLDLRDHILDFWDWALGREVEIIEGPKPFLPSKSSKPIPAQSPFEPRASRSSETPPGSR